MKAIKLMNSIPYLESSFRIPKEMEKNQQKQQQIAVSIL